MKNGSPGIVVLIGSLIVGAIYALTIFDVSFVLGQSQYWTSPFGDRITNLIGSQYFVRDAWRLPLFFVPNLSTPGGANIIYTDSLPFLALIAKLYFNVTGVWVNYFGLWLFLCFPLLAMFVARAGIELGVKSLLSLGVLIGLALANPALLVRYGHAALMGHFLIAWSFLIYLEMLKQPKKISLICQICIVILLSVTLQAYFLLMVLPFFVAALLQALVNGKILLRRFLCYSGVVVGFILILAWLVGLIGQGSPNAAAWGFGYYSMNILSPFLPPQAHLPNFLGQYIKWDGNGYSWDATGGQYEGYNYLGFGVLFLIVVHAFKSREIIKSSIKKNIFLFIALFGLLLLALSNKVFLGSVQVLEIPLIFPIDKLTMFFRTGGRLFWPIYYVLVVALVYWTFRRFSFLVGNFLLCLALILQLGDTEILRFNMRTGTQSGYKQELPRSAWRSLLESHKFIKQYPSFQCGGWGKGWPENNSNMELLLMAAQLNLPSNSAYLARLDRDCEAELKEGESFDILPGGLYVFGNTFPIRKIEENPVFKDLCREFNYGIVCTRSGWLNDVNSFDAKAFEPITKKWAPKYILGKVIDFKVGGNGSDFLRGGWSAPEDWGVWGVGKQSEIVFQLDPSSLKGAVNLIVKSRRFIVNPSSFEEVEVFINGKVAGVWKYNATNGGLTTHEISLPEGIFQEGSIVRVRFASSMPSSPREAGMSSDDRLLGIGLIDMVLRPI